MDQQSTAISKLAGVVADLVYPHADEILLERYYLVRGRAVLSPHGAFEDPTASADVLPRVSIALRTIAFHSV